MIRHNANIRARIVRLEQRKKARQFPRMTFGLFDRDDSEIIGAEADIVGSSPIHVMRLPDEATSALIQLAYNVTGALSLRIVYAQARQSAAEREERRSAAHAAPDTVMASGGPEIDPDALAGIGRRATDAELWASGCTRGPPERLR